MHTEARIVGILMLALSLGCSGGSSQSVTPAKTPELKVILTQVAESGELEDMKEAISTHIEKIEITDPAKGKELSADYEGLRKSQTPSQVKELAKKMAAKL